MKVLSLFDGMVCGYLAMQSAGIEVERYVAYEIDKYAIQTATHNFPDIEEQGDVFAADFSIKKGFDIIVGGSPCTHWSIAQTKNRETTASGVGWDLFSQYVRALHEVEPQYFVYENNKSMSAEIRRSISETFGFEPICINSALVSAQNRQRLYWVGKRNANGTYSKVDVEQPEDRGILLRDILETGCDLTCNDNSFVLTASYDGACAWNTIERHQRNMVAEPVCVAKNGKSRTIKAQYYKNSAANFVTNSGYNATAVVEPCCVASRGRNPENLSSRKAGEYTEQHLEAHEYGKTNTLTTVAKDNLVAEPINDICGKANTLRASDGAHMGQRNMLCSPNDKRTGVAVPVQVGRMPREDGIVTESKQYRVYSIDGKAVTQCGQGGGLGAKTGLYAIPVELDENCKPTKAQSLADGKIYTVYEVEGGQITIKGKRYPIKLIDGYYIIRKLTVRECMRLQTVPEWYEFPVSNTQAYKMLGNGWVVEVIAHLLKAIKADIVKEEENE